MSGDGTDLYGDEYDGDDELIFTSQGTYLNLPEASSVNELEAAGADVAVVGAPLDTAVTGRPGTRYGPKAIRAAHTIPSPPYKHFNIETGVDPFDTLKVVDYGDVPVSPGDTRASQRNVQAAIEEVSATGAVPIVLGGDHSITQPNYLGFAEGRGYDDVGIIHFDCHTDTAEDGVGFEYDHGAHVSRIAESDYFDGDTYTLIGPRGFWPDPESFEWMAEEGMRWYTAEDVARDDPVDIADDAVERATDGTDAVWITFDVDVMEPAFCPGTGVPEPFGLVPRDVATMIRRIVRQLDPEHFGFDVVEVAPQYDTGEGGAHNGGITAMFANRLVLEVLGGLALAADGRETGSPVESP
jgi:agmatinase